MADQLPLPMCLEVAKYVVPWCGTCKLPLLSSCRRLCRSDPANPGSFVVQRYVSNPFLVGGKKFDLRLYLLVTSFRPLTAYIYRDGFAKFSSKRFRCERDLCPRDTCCIYATCPGCFSCSCFFLCVIFRASLFSLFWGGVAVGCPGHDERCSSTWRTVCSATRRLRYTSLVRRGLELY